MILLIESGVHKFFGGHNHSHFPSQDTLAKKMADVEVGNQLYKILENRMESWYKTRKI